MKFLKKRKNSQIKNDVNKKITPTDKENIGFSSGELFSQSNNDIGNIEQEVSPVMLEELPLDFKTDYSNLHEIKDISVIARLNSITQCGTQQFIQIVQKNQINKVIKNTGNLLQSDIPIDQLSKAKDYSGGFRATLMGKKGIEKNAILTKFDSSKISQQAKVAVGLGAVMNAASFVVGQYYMKEISLNLSNINKNISVIGNFQQQEFKSKIMALDNNVEEISKFSNEILRNPELKKSELYQLNGYKNDTVQLLQQVNITIQELTDKNIEDIQEYEAEIKQIKKLLVYQKILIDILKEISKMTYTLNLGIVSTEKCFSSYNNLLDYSNETIKLIPNWHSSNLKNLKIELKNNRFKKKGIEGIVNIPLSLIDKKFEYKKLDPNLKNSIIQQNNIKEVEDYRPTDFFDDNVELIIKNGKYYYNPINELSIRETRNLK